MAGAVLLEPADADGVARVTLRHAGKQNAISVAMWHEIRRMFEALQAEDPALAPRAVILRGDGGHFAAGADIEEFPGFRFEEATLAAYHEETIAPALAALLACDIPLVAAIEGSCVGGGLEIAACCDLRIASPGARFGIPIAKLGFPLAPGELLAASRVADAATLRELLLEARLLDAATALARGLVHRLADDPAAEAEATARRVAALPAHAARLNKRSLRHLAEGSLGGDVRRSLFGYARHPDHQEGVRAFLEKRPARFEGGAP